jgi:hypothetical protein
MLVFIDNFVCRPALKGEKTAGKRGRKRTSASVDDKSSQGKAKKKAGKRDRNLFAPGEDDNSSVEKPRYRGTLKARTCSNCKRVFTSELGLEYHFGTYTLRQLQCFLMFASSLSVYYPHHHIVQTTRSVLL